MSNELIRFCLQQMASKDHLTSLMGQMEIPLAGSRSYAGMADKFFENGNAKITLAEIVGSFRERWTACPREFHLANLMSGKLAGHNWHGTMPSFLHLGMQAMVRECVLGEVSLDALLVRGTDIMRHQYFMVATHDLIESALIETFDDTIPPSRPKSVSDFVFRNLPYDLKNTNYFDGWNKDAVLADKAGVVTKLIAGADTDRLRKQAKDNPWACNRFFVLVENQDRWLSDPEGLLTEMMEQAKTLNAPLTARFENVDISCQVIAV